MRRWWDFRRAPAAARTLVELGRHHGVPEVRALQATGLTVSDLADEDRPVEAGQELAIVRNLLAELGDRPGLGAEAGRRYTLGTAGILGFALLSSPTVRDAALIGSRYLGLTSAFVRPELEEDGRSARIVLHDEQIPEDVRGFFVERDLAAIARMLPLIVPDGALRQLRVELALDPPRGRALAALLAPTPLSPGADRTLLALPRAVLDLAPPQADAHTAAMCERQCRELLERRRRLPATAAAVRSRLLHDPARMPSMEEVAAELHVDARTLRRRLAAEGSSFRGLRDEVRSTLAAELLDRAGLTVAEVAGRLGYSETAGFTHAFKRWTGAAPSLRGRAA